MTQSLSEQDLAMLRMALEGARSADAVVRFTYAVLADRYGLVDGDQIDAGTGRLMRRNEKRSATGPVELGAPETLGLRSAAG